MFLLILAKAAIALQAKNLILGHRCGALLIVALLQIFGAANPSRCKVVMLLSCLLAFGDTGSSEAKPHIAEIYSIFAATTDVQALANLAILYGSEEVSVSFARVPMVVTGSVACFARYFIHFCLLASLHDTSYYSVTTSAAGQLKLVTSVRSMIFSSTKANPRTLILMLLIMSMNIAAVFTVATFATSESTATTILKRAVQAALHMFGEAVRTPIGANGEGFSAQSKYQGALPNLDAAELSYGPSLSYRWAVLRFFPFCKYRFIWHDMHGYRGWGEGGWGGQ